ncbi:MAG: GLPGLI family protein [Bergeyella sp.]
MKKLILFFLLTSIDIFSQKIDFDSHTQFIYDLEYQTDSLNTDSKFSETLILYIGNNKSIFQSEKKAMIDSIMASTLFQSSPQNLNYKPFFRVNNVILKDLTKDEIIFSEILDKVNMGYKENISEIMNWKLENESKEILGYKCKKATTYFRGRNYVAWYTEKIPISNGPYKFGGLPGLILELSDVKLNFHYKLIQIINKPKKILYDEKLLLVDRKRLLQTKINLLKRNSNAKINPIEKE